MNKAFEEIVDLKKQYENKLQKEGREALKAAFKEIFAAHPRLKSIVWTQYTPYFNDGSPCNFRVREFDINYLEAEDDEPDDCDYNYGDTLYTAQESKDKEVKTMAEAVGELANNIPEDILQTVFGDHCKVVATPEGFDVREHDHD